MVPRVRWMTVVDPRPGHSSRDAWVRRFYEFRGGQMRDGLLAPEGAAKSRWRFSTSIISLKGKAVWPEAAQVALDDLLSSFQPPSPPPPSPPQVKTSGSVDDLFTSNSLHTLLRSTRAALPCHSIRPTHYRRPHSLFILFFSGVRVFLATCFETRNCPSSLIGFLVKHYLSHDIRWRLGSVRLAVLLGETSTPGPTGRSPAWNDDILRLRRHPLCLLCCTLFTSGLLVGQGLCWLRSQEDNPARALFSCHCRRTMGLSLFCDLRQ
jgi:hypothetical protein